MEDPVSNVLKWVLLAVAVGCFALFAWATVLTYERAAPQPHRFVGAGGATLITADDIVAGKAGFQKADLMDYGSLYGMGSYFGQDYTAFALMRLAKLTDGEARQQWMCAITSFDVKPLKVALICIVWAVASRITVARPVAGEPAGSTSFA
jgi:nitric oxide reductase large subunit